MNREIFDKLDQYSPQGVSVEPSQWWYKVTDVDQAIAALTAEQPQKVEVTVSEIENAIYGLAIATGVDQFAAPKDNHDD